MAKKALGKGLGALISSTNNVSQRPRTQAESRARDEVIEVTLSQVTASPLQPRREFPAESLAELVESIRERGIIQPLIVRRVKDRFELIAGERRLRASREAGLKCVPVIVREASDQDVLEMALVENLQRQDLNPMEEAAGYVRLAREFKLKQEEIANRVGKSRATVANSMRLLDLTPELQGWVSQGRLSIGHAKVVLSLKDDAQRHFVAQRVVERNLTVRQTERIVHELRNGQLSKPAKPSERLEADPRLDAFSRTLAEQLATEVSIRNKGGKSNKGRIEICYRNPKELERILELLGIDPDDFA